MSDYLIQLLIDGTTNEFTQVEYEIFKVHKNENKYILRRTIEAMTCDDNSQFYQDYIVYDDSFKDESGLAYSTVNTIPELIKNYGDFVAL